jgi:hypothetical protein
MRALRVPLQPVDRELDDTSALFGRATVSFHPVQAGVDAANEFVSGHSLSLAATRPNAKARSRPPVVLARNVGARKLDERLVRDTSSTVPRQRVHRRSLGESGKPSSDYESAAFVARPINPTRGFPSRIPAIRCVRATRLPITLGGAS